jgi:hypothetical protein
VRLLRASLRGAASEDSVASGVHLRPGQRGDRVPAEAAVAFEVVCSCGRPVRGERRTQHQVVPCPTCGQALFILPRGAWPAGATRPAAAAAARAPHRLLWRLALAAVAAAALGSIVLYLVLHPLLSPRPASSEPVQKPDEARQSLEAGRQALAAGSYRRARQLFKDALEQAGIQPEGLTAEEARELARLDRQADLLARLLPLSLEELLHQGRHVSDDHEWQQMFADYYQGRTVLFDDVVRRNAAGRPVLALYAVTDGGVSARLALEDLTLWQRVPLDPPARLLFGARLQRLAREEGGAWVVRFEPDSGVLLTDAKAAATVCPVPLEADLLEVLHRQASWDRR